MTVRMRYLTLFAMTLMTTPALAQDRPSLRPSVTVIDFETQRTAWMPPPGFGTTVAELLSERLVESGQYRVLDQQWVIGGGDSRARPSLEELCARARLSGVDYVVLGSVTRFSSSTSNSRDALIDEALQEAIANAGEAMVTAAARLVRANSGTVAAAVQRY